MKKSSNGMSIFLLMLVLVKEGLNYILEYTYK